MSVIALPFAQKPELHTIKSIALQAAIPALWRAAMLRAWPDVQVLGPNELKESSELPDVVIGNAANFTRLPNQYDALPRLCVVVDDHQAEAVTKFADILLFPQLSAPQFLGQIQLMDNLLKRQRAVFATNQRVAKRLENLQDHYQVLDEDLAKAKILRDQLTAKQSRIFPNGGICLKLWPKEAIGGDLMGVFEAGPDHTGFFSIDVSGHGVAAALFCAQLAGLMVDGSTNSNIALTTVDGKTMPRDPAWVMSEFNRMMFEHYEVDLYFTAILGFLDHTTNIVKFCQAGHPSPIVFGGGKPAKVLETSGLPVGLVPGAEFETTELNVPKSARLLLYSDGISESNPPIGEGFFADSAMLRTINQSHADKDEDVLQNLYDAAKRFSGDDLQDDACAMVISFT